ncbi:MAG: hypothetical protein KAT58_10265 [candidate division Zixibacteria bacterium]|nr:hypothetical protein [candidate division Zixibacteria bacterium]
MTKFHGVTSLGLAAVATVIAAIAIFQTSWVFGIVYLVICAAAPGAILYAYCAKCPCKEHCAHVFPGKAAMAFDRKPGPYTTTEMAVLVLALLLLIGLPQFWLWRYTGWFIAFWALSGIALVQVRAVVCRTCDNVYCPLRTSS